MKVLTSECTCEPVAVDKCANVDCPNYCATSVGKNGQPNDYDVAKNVGDCDPATGECVNYEEDVCTAGCAMTTAAIPEAYCKEDCDNNADDDHNGLADCKDPACATSPYCTCQSVDQNTGSSGGKKLNIIVCGLQIPATELFADVPDQGCADNRGCKGSCDGDENNVSVQ